ncbi:MAG TPA: accessory factor UbiK family protein [Gammaproteobacteria bacterium]|jgi:hypothetical protein
MTQPRSLDDLVRRIAAALPQGISQMNDEVRKNLKEVLSASLSRMDLVSREEFEVQSAVLARTREKLERLEAQVAALEASKRGGKQSSRG